MDWNGLAAALSHFTYAIEEENRAHPQKGIRRGTTLESLHLLVAVCQSLHLLKEPRSRTALRAVIPRPPCCQRLGSSFVACPSAVPASRHAKATNLCPRSGVSHSVAASFIAEQGQEGHRRDAQNWIGNRQWFDDNGRRAHARVLSLDSGGGNEGAPAFGTGIDPRVRHPMKQQALPLTWLLEIRAPA